MALGGFLQIAIILLGAVLAVPLLYVGLRLFRADPAQYELNRQRSGSFSKVFFGEIPTVRNGVRDLGTCAAVTMARRCGAAGKPPRGKWILQGKLSNESVDSILG